jgi:tRNA(His) 5'-end guanylyltransferase
MKDDLGNRMKEYELAEAGQRLMPTLPICARIDGKRFSRFTEGLERPFDLRLSRLMIATTRYLVEETAACVGYTQSDEMSLVWHEPDPRTKSFLDRRVQKLTSILASMATGYFNAHLAAAIPEKAGSIALFDCRVWAVPNREEAANVFLWRELDATKNSVSMAARAHYPHAEIVDRDNAEMHELLFKKGVNWNDYPPFFKRGTFLRRQAVERAFTVTELESLPPLHAARSNPALTVTRTTIAELEMPAFGKVINRVGVLFEGEAPRTAPPGAAESSVG